MRNWHKLAVSAAARGLLVVFAAFVWLAAAGGAMAQPTIGSSSPFSPSWGTGLGGTEVTISGTGFSGTVVTVLFGELPATNVVVDSDTSLRATTPALLAPQGGYVSVTVTVDGESVTQPAFDWTNGLYGFSYSDNQPGVAYISPPSGPAAGGTAVTITGDWFTGASAVLFGSTPALSYQVVDDETITAVAPAGTGTVDIYVVNPTGEPNCACAFGGATVPATFTYLPAPVVTSLQAMTYQGVEYVAYGGGQFVNLTGTGFTGATSVQFGAAPATSLTVLSDTSMYATSPAGTLGTSVDVTVTTPGGTSATGHRVTFGNTAQPGVDTISPSSGPTSGGTAVTITGSQFTGASSVEFGGDGNGTVPGTPATSFTVVNDGTITAIAPAGTGTVDIFVRDSIGVSNCACGGAAAQFTYYSVPVVTKLVRNGGVTAGGDSVVLTGSGFASATAVSFGGTAAASFLVNSDNQITATTPAGTGNVNVTVTTLGGTSATGAGNLFYYGAPQPVIIHMGPNQGSEAGNVGIVILGSGFTGASRVLFGTTPGTNLSVQSDGEIWVDAPPGTGAVDVIVEAPGGDSAPGSSFSYVPIPGAISITPSSGPEAGGTAVTLTGSGFTGDIVTVYFGSRGAAELTINSDTSLTAISPPGTGTVDVKVETRGGFSPIAAFTYIPPGPPQDSLNAEIVQQQLSGVVAKASGRAISGAISSGIAQGLSGRSTIAIGSESAFMAYAPGAGAVGPFAGFDQPGFIQNADWNAWLAVQGSGLFGGGSGRQLNVTAGVGYRFTEDFVAGVVGGQESFSYSSTAVSGLLSGSGLSAGAYLGWRFSDQGMFDAAIVGSALGYDITSGLATGSFDASRWLLTSGVTGEFELGDNLTISPSARVFALWEHQEDWVDSLATAHAARSFSNGTASGGANISGSWMLTDDLTLQPYFGLFADYQFDSASNLTGLEGRVTGGLNFDTNGSAAINIGAELGGLGSAQGTWALNAGVSGGF